jgi:dienelactone hydrolase
VTVSRPDGSTFGAVVHYPVQMNKEGAPASRIAFPVPVISFGHAYLSTPDLCASTLDHLASNGYIVIASRSGSELFPDHEQFAEDMGYCLTFLVAQTSQPNSQWYQQVDVERLGLLGHSMGGGAAVLAAATDERIKAVASMAAAETRPSAVEAAGRVTAPICFLIATEDRIAPAERHAMPMYEAAGSPKLAFLIEGGFHCGFLDANAFGCDDGSLGRADQLAITWDRLVAFFDLYLRELPDARERVLAPSPPEGPHVTILDEQGGETVN